MVDAALHEDEVVLELHGVVALAHFERAGETVKHPVGLHQLEGNVRQPVADCRDPGFEHVRVGIGIDEDAGDDAVTAVLAEDIEKRADGVLGEAVRGIPRCHVGEDVEVEDLGLHADSMLAFPLRRP